MHIHITASTVIDILIVVLTIQRDDVILINKTINAYQESNRLQQLTATVESNVFKILSACGLFIFYAKIIQAFFSLSIYCQINSQWNCVH